MRYAYAEINFLFLQPLPFNTDIAGLWLSLNHKFQIEDDFVQTIEEINAPPTTRRYLVEQTISGGKKCQMSMLATQHDTTKDMVRSQLRSWQRQDGPACIREKKGF